MADSEEGCGLKGPAGSGCLSSKPASSPDPADRQEDSETGGGSGLSRVQPLCLSHLPPCPQPVSLLGAAAVRQLLDDVADGQTAATRRHVLFLHLQPAERAHGETLRGGGAAWTDDGVSGCLEK